ncbi:ABC transporter ATP-binding protein [Peribacillus kribbensis]|uniref:ABC transporter ATP-binding protein n=1 Tax=Peribacillus kribbensis TaxID=356658 RepID=UPI000413456F|nr:ABC transporter ATP-binding protein [Peribacillus kribbensis]
MNNLHSIKQLAKEYFSFKDIIRTYSLLKPFILRRWKAYTVLAVMLFINIFTTIVFAWYFGAVTDAAIQSDFSKLKLLVPMGAGLLMFSMVSSYVNSYCETIASTGVKRDLENYLFSHVLRLPAKNTANLRSGDLISHFTTDLHSIDGIIGSSLIDLIRLPVIYMVVFIYLYHINSTIALISLCTAPAAAVLGVFFGLILRRNGRKIFDLVSSLNGMISETFQGLHVVRTFTLEKVLFDRFSGRNRKLMQLELENTKLRSWFFSAGTFISYLIYFISVCLGSLYISKGTLTVGALLTFLNLVNHLVYPMTGLAGQWAGFQRSIIAADRLLRVLEQKAEAEELPDYIKPAGISMPIEMKDLSFGYQEDQILFQKFNLSLPTGKVIAVVGPSGAGKSTLFSLIQGIYKPFSGEIQIGGKPIEDMILAELRSSIAFVPQETFLFGGSIKDNLMLAKPGLTEREMIRACQDAYIHDFIRSLPYGYDTQIGERGVKLSGGQKQRIAIARALLKDAPILMLDEATSALDTETEHYVQQALDKLVKGRTTLIIAHRLSTVKSADLIVVLNEGRLIQSGSHQELMGQEGLYRKLYHSEFSKRKQLELVSI